MCVCLQNFLPHNPNFKRIWNNSKSIFSLVEICLKTNPIFWTTWIIVSRNFFNLDWPRTLDIHMYVYQYIIYTVYIDNSWTSFILCYVVRDYLIDCLMINRVSVILRQPVHLSLLSWSYFNQTPHKNIFKPPANFPHNRCRNNGHRKKRNESCRNDHDQFSGKISAKPFSPTMFS